MNNRESPLFWSFSCGTWFATRVRVSIYFPLLVALICWRLKDLQLGLIFSAILFVSVVVHEIGHVLAARRTGGAGSEILIWPLGGLALVQPAHTLSSQVLTTAAGPLFNLILCALTLAVAWNSGDWTAAINPLQLPYVELADNMVGDVLLLTFWANWVLFLVNLIPVYPLDGGRLLQTLLANKLGAEVGTGFYLRVGFFAAFIAMVAGLLMDSTWLVFIGAIVMALNCHEMLQMHTADSYDDSFMGYDFSQGYTSLERSQQSTREQRPGLLKRWREKRRAQRALRDEMRDVEAEKMLDELLNKIHEHGQQSLSDAERRQLERASARLRERGKPNK